MVPRIAFALLVLGMSGWAESAVAQVTTTIRVRVVSHDAKVIGSGVGGARVIVRDPRTGSVLAEGLQEGGTGDTRAIVIDQVERRETIYDTPGAAQFTFDVELTEPTVLEFVGEGPLGYEQALQRTSKTMLIVPGEDVLGNGIVLELHGFIVELLEPKAAAAGEQVQVTARVRMMCGCTQEPGGLWDADRLTVTARIYDGETLVRSAPLSYAGEVNMFSGQVSLEGLAGGERLFVVVADAPRANFGRSETVVVH
ncbi:MAG: hypothetical protein PVF27_06860 [Gemmatimonadales bacterium]|jgi:hypothetical protein